MINVSNDSKIGDFVNKYGIANSNVSTMMMSAIRNGMPEVYAKMEDRVWYFEELVNVIKSNLEE